MTDTKVAEAERRVAEAWRGVQRATEKVRHAPPDMSIWARDVYELARMDLDAAIRAHERARLVAALRGYMDQGFDTVADMIEEGRLP